MKFLDCNKEDFETYEKFLTLNTWAMTKSFFDFTAPEDGKKIIIQKIKVESEVVALIEYSKGTYDENSLCIDNFEVFHKGNGIGSEILDFIKKETRGSVIELYASTKRADSFWKKHGFEEDNDGSGTIILRLFN
ncbi:GNAT family N-acetyltransferase [Falsibacillus albus]|uniref:N-acetyltransferase n=1 Tax=Falsibacillus albus TaxID=2478915 RepID=A0A3L7JTM1_9BACI|nr:GNAT family N-acetyltransferase [Falsibacillus albus]RLQ93614.1 N-acetyltransferase [Falsibacillus albus]